MSLGDSRGNRGFCSSVLLGSCCCLIVKVEDNSLRFSIFDLRKTKSGFQEEEVKSGISLFKGLVVQWFRTLS